MKVREENIEIKNDCVNTRGSVALLEIVILASEISN